MVSGEQDEHMQSTVERRGGGLLIDRHHMLDTCQHTNTRAEEHVHTYLCLLCMDFGLTVVWKCFKCRYIFFFFFFCPVRQPTLWRIVTATIISLARVRFVTGVLHICVYVWPFQTVCRCLASVSDWKPWIMASFWADERPLEPNRRISRLKQRRSTKTHQSNR